MKHTKSLEKLKSLLEAQSGIQLAVVYGSYARKDFTPNSDLDIHIIRNEELNFKSLVNELKQLFNDELRYVLPVAQKEKVVLYFKDYPKIEISISNKTDKLKRDFIGSEITDIESAIIHKAEDSSEVQDLIGELEKGVPEYLNKTTLSTYIDEIIDRFLYEFENCSSSHGKSDGYRFYFFYNIALHSLIQLESLKYGTDSFNFLPKQLTSKIIQEEYDQKEIYALAGSIYLPDANKKKRSLLDRFYKTVETFVSSDKLMSIKNFCEDIYKRDAIWNFRDLSENIPTIQPQLVFRSALLTIYQYDDQLSDLIESKNITTIIDLRAQRELTEFKYIPKIKSTVNYVHCPLDPWDQPDWFQKEYQKGSNAEIAYLYFIMCCQESITKALRQIANSNGGVVIHCHAGKDRTGILAALISIISGASTDHIIQDYLASENDTQSSLLKIVLDYIQDEGGLTSYLVKAGMSENEILQLKSKLTTNEY